MSTPCATLDGHRSPGIPWRVLPPLVSTALIMIGGLNALVPNEQRGRVLTLYVLTYGLFFGAGQLFGQNLNVRGPELLIIAGIATTLALVPMVAIDVRAPVMQKGVKLDILKALRTSPVSFLACVLNGLILTAFTTVGPLFSERIGFDQRRIVLLMACTSLGGMLLRWPIGYFSDKVDRRYALVALGAGVLAVATVLVLSNSHTPFLVFALCFAVFGGLAESLYAVGVAHANDRAVITDYVALSSTLLFVWALGAAIGPTTGTFAIQLTGPRAFFVYVTALTSAFTLFTLWRLYRHRFDPAGLAPRNSWPTRRPRRKSTPGCPTTAKPPTARRVAPTQGPPPRQKRGQIRGSCRCRRSAIAEILPGRHRRYCRASRPWAASSA